jgi:AcrR family transcriptional regulator
MTETDLGPKERILHATIAMLNEEDDLSKITVRRIADWAGVGIGLINYHFQTKENLLNEAVGMIMGQEAARWLGAADLTETDPVTRLKMLLKETSKIALRYPMLSEIAISHALLRGNMDVEQMVLPMFRQIFGEGATELRVRLAAFQLIASAQVAFLRSREFRTYVGIDLFNDRQRDEALDLLVDNLIGEYK